MRQQVLIVDDNELNCKLAKALLLAHGFQIHSAINGNEALKLLDEEDFDLIIMDIALPDVDGLELTKQIKATKKYKDIPVVAVTAFAMKADEERALKAGCVKFICKPISTIDFANTMEDVLRNFGKNK